MHGLDRLLKGLSYGPTRGLKNPCRCVEFQITYLVQEYGKLGNDVIIMISLLLFIIDLIPLSHTLRKVNAEYQLRKGQHKNINHLPFIDDLKLCGNAEEEAASLTNTVRIFSKDIAMEFGISKCAHVTMKAGKLVSVGGMKLSSGGVIQELEEENVTST